MTARILVLWLLLPAAQAGATAAQSGEQPDLSPPRLKAVRWQYLEKRFQDVYVDGSGRAWFVIRTFNADQSLGQQMHMVCTEATQSVIEVPASSYPLGFDGRDRFWEISKYGLMCTDSRTGKFSQRTPAPCEDQEKLRVDRESGKPFVMFSPRMLEHSAAGRLYFPDSLGIHVLEDEQWSYWKFDPPSDKPSLFVQYLDSAGRARQCTAFQVPVENFPGALGSRYQTTELSDSRVAVHDGQDRRWFIHDGKNWSSQTEAPVPAAGNGPSEAAAAHARRGIRRSTDVNDTAKVLGGELAGYGTICGQDRQGRIYVKCMSQEFFSGFHRIAVLDSRYADDGPQLDYECHKVAFGGQSSNPALVTLDSAGNVWARLDRGDDPFLSRFENGQWRHFDAPRPAGAPPQDTGFNQLPFIIPMKRGCLLAGGKELGRAYFFDGRQWHGGCSLRDLVAAHYEQLRGVIDNIAVSQGFVRGIVCVGLDATGRIHYRSGRAGSVFDGKAWTEPLPDFICFNADGSRCLTGSAVYDSSVRPAKAVAATPGEADSPWGGHFFDSKGRAWLQGDASRQPSRFQDGRWTRIELQQEYGPMLEDSAGRFWFNGHDFEKQSHAWRVLGPDASKPDRQVFYHYGQMRGPIVEGANGLFWAAAGDGLLSLRVQGKGPAPKAVLADHYMRIIPPGMVSWMGMDNQHCLWIATWGGQSHLYRIKTPGCDSAANSTTAGADRGVVR